MQGGTRRKRFCVGPNGQARQLLRLKGVGRQRRRQRNYQIAVQRDQLRRQEQLAVVAQHWVAHCCRLTAGPQFQWRIGFVRR